MVRRLSLSLFFFPEATHLSAAISPGALITTVGLDYLLNTGIGLPCFPTTGRGKHLHNIHLFYITAGHRGTF